jgi:hypothetical protein
MKFTKTQQALLDQLAKRGRIGLVRAMGRGPQGGRISAGVREVEAALQLEGAGLLKRVGYVRDKVDDRGHSITYTSLVFVAPDKEPADA